MTQPSRRPIPLDPPTTTSSHGFGLGPLRGPEHPASRAVRFHTSSKMPMPSRRKTQTSGSRPPQELHSPEVTAQGRVTFRVHAPKAAAVSLGPIGDLASIGIGVGKPFRKGADGVWTLTLQRVPPGAHRYQFNVDGLTILDPRNPRTSESNEHAWSLVNVPGAPWMEPGSDTPRGGVSALPYWSTVRRRFRRLHVYTPPGYEGGRGRFPALYLLHGAFDSDHSWSTVGRAADILDTLIAAGQARPMVVVMPHGHVGPFQLGMPMWGEFEPEFLQDILPFVESRFRIQSHRRGRALAGLSMGGGHTLNLGFTQPNLFNHLGVFSSGIFDPKGLPHLTEAPIAEFERRHLKVLSSPARRRGFPELWFATGRRDFLLGVTQSTVDFLRKHDFQVTYHETEGGHTWDRWRDYLRQFLPLLFPKG